MSAKEDQADISAHLPLIHILWQQGVINAFDYKELTKIALNPAHHHLLSSPLLLFVDSLKQIESQHSNNEEKKHHNDDDEEKLNIVHEIKTFQTSIRPLITRAIHLSCSSHITDTSSAHFYHHILNVLMNNTILPKHMLFLIEKSILSTISTLHNTQNMIDFNDMHCLSIDDCYTFVCCSDERQLDKKIFCMLQSVLTKEISIFNECQESLADEINIIQSIFSGTQDEHIVVHKEIFPIMIDVCLSSKNKIAKLYLTFLCSIDYPLRSAIKSSIYFCGPPSFATNNDVWNELRVPLQQMIHSSMDDHDAHLFDIIQFAKEWMQACEVRYDELQKESLYGQESCQYIELRTALGLNVDKAAMNKADQTKIEINTKHESKNESMNGSKTYIWYIKDVNNNWCEFPQNMQKKINNLCINSGVLLYCSNNHEYIITKHSPAKAIQRNRVTHTQREIKRRIRNHNNNNKSNATKERQKTQIRTQCFSKWEIDEIIRKLIQAMSIKWQCNKAIAMQKLVQSLWSYDNINMDNNNIIETDNISLYNNIAIEDYKCAVCLETHSMFAGIKIECQHIICVECLSSYIVNQINNGILCIQCPEFECKSLLNDCVVHILSDDISYSRYRQFIRNSFLSTTKHFNFCPNPACDSAIQYDVNSKRVPLLVCNCSIPLCTSCISKFHFPLTCRENKQWSNKCNKTNHKLSDPNLPDLPEFEGQKYEMIVKTKACPRCKTAWEKNGGCNHILCRKCKYHFCWVCLKEFNHLTHDDFYECKQGIVELTQDSKITMDKPTERYIAAYKEALQKRKQIREEHQKENEADITRKLRTKRAIQHERASIFLQQKYLKKTKRLKILLRNIILCTQQNTGKEKVAKQLNMLFMYELISRMIQTHLLLSRGYKYISYHDIAENDTICCILKSLEHVAFKLDAMFQQPKEYLPYEECRWKWSDLGFYIEFFTTEMLKVCSLTKERKQPKPKKTTNPFMRVSNHQY